ncbi:MAG: TonB-dependent receptor [Saprospiraceae bacterium]|nr:TonB-dependent receptor [Saprospiraceae bacterium]
MFFLRTLFVLVALGWCVSLSGQCTIYGEVTGPDGEPLLGADIVIPALQLGAVADADGNYEIRNVPVGQHELSVSFLGYASYRQTVVITQTDQRKRVDIDLRPEALDLGAVTVLSTRANNRTPMTFTNLDRADLTQQNLGQDAPFILRWTPSAVVTSDAGAGIGYTGIRIRGTDPTRINVTINGIPLNDAESQGVFWVNMPDFMSSTSDVQIQRGVGTSTNGAGAFGATINLNTSKVQQEPLAQVNASVGSFNTFKRNVQFGTGLLNDKFTIDGRLSKITSDGYIDRASSDLSSYYLSGAYVSDKALVRFNAFSGHEITYQAWNGVPAELVDDRDTRTFNSAGTEKQGEPYEDEVDNYRQTHYQLLYNQQLDGDWTTNVALHYTIGQGFFEQYKAEQDLADYGLETQTTNGELPDLVRRLWLDNDFYGGVFGANLEREQFTFTLGGGFHIYEGLHFGEIIWSELAEGLIPDERYYENDARKQDANIFARLNYELLPGLRTYLDLQYRGVSYDFIGLNRQGATVDQTAQLSFFNPKVGLQYEWDERTQAYASFAVANREPNRNDYVESTPDSRPQHEQLLDTEVGFKKSFDRGSLEATGYYMYYNDQLVLNGELNDVGASTRVNVDKSYRLGLELVGGYQINDQFRVEGTTTLSRNKINAFRQFVDVFLDDGGFTQEETLFENTDLSFSPSFIGAAEINWTPIGAQQSSSDRILSLSLMSKYVSEQFLDNTSDPNNVINPYFFSDFRIKYTLKNVFAQNIQFTALIQNVFDAMYETNGWSYRYQAGGESFLLRGYYPQAGRNFLFGISVTF